MHKIALSSLVIALAAAGSLLSIPPASACSPAPGWPPTAAQNLARKDAAFIGTVQGIVQDKSLNGEYRVTFRVDERIKGTLAQTVTVRIQSSSAACGYDNGHDSFKEGSVWSIYASGNAADGYRTDSLSLNSSYASVASAHDAIVTLGLISSVNASMPMTDLTVGSRSAGVTWLQQYLIAHAAGPRATSLASAGATGYFGAMTRAALAEYQAANAIAPAQGYYGAKTRAFILNAPQVPETPAASATTFTGKIEAVDTGCFADGTCSVTVGGKKVVVAAGLRVPPIPPLGSLKGVDSIGDLEDEIGSMARVYAARTPAGSEEDFTLYGNAAYYLALVGDAPREGKVTLRGTMTCLPHLDPSGINTMECAFGLEAEDGNYYALRDSDLAHMNVTGAGSGERVEVKGAFEAGTSDRYPTIGTVEVESIKKI